MITALPRNAGIPLYYQLKTILREQIRSGALKPGQKLPNEEQLAAAYRVSLITVRRTLADLAAEGFLRRMQGRGTFVAEPVFAQGPRELTSFTYEMERRGLQASSKVLLKEVIPATGSVAAALEIPPGTDVFHLRRLRLAGGEPMGIQTAHIPLAIAPGLPSEDLERNSLYSVLRRYGILPARGKEVHSAVLLTAEQARLLGRRRGAPGLAVVRTTYARDGRPFELVHSVMRGDRYQVVLDLVARFEV